MISALIAWLVKVAFTMKVHFEAFSRAPRAYLTAVKWRVLGKRVRARGHFAVLLARAPSAYQWQSLMGRLNGKPQSPPGMPPIIVLLREDSSPLKVDETLGSLAAEHLITYLIGDDPVEALKAIAAEVDWTQSPWFMPIVAGDKLAPGAARSYRDALACSSFHVIYADDDRVTTNGRRCAPHYKPDWNPELQRHHDYLTGACIIKADRAALERAAHTKDWSTALVEGALLSGGGAGHVRQILHHRCVRPAPRLPLSAVKVAPALPKLSVIIPTRNRVELLSKCITGLAVADYPDFEVIVVDNDSDEPATCDFLACLPERGVRVMSHPGVFNYSKINNRAVAKAAGDLICFLNNDTEMLTADWLSIMATQALREEVGAVGAQLLYPDGRLQHAGVVIGVGNAAGHAHRFLRPKDDGYFKRHSLPQFVTAVTAACLVVRRERFLAVGGFDEVAFPVAFNDVDLCLKLNSRGWQSFYEPRAVLVHYESVSRGFDRDPSGAARFARELAMLKSRWQTDKVFDPYHHPQLSRASEQFALALSHG